MDKTKADNQYLTEGMVSESWQCKRCTFSIKVYGDSAIGEFLKEEKRKHVKACKGVSHGNNIVDDNDTDNGSRSDSCSSSVDRQRLSSNRIRKRGGA